MEDKDPRKDQTETFVPVSALKEISHYKILSRVGAGGMGEIYLAEDSKLDRQVAIKFLPDKLLQNKDLVARFTREAKAAAKLNHPNIVTVYEVGEHDNRPFFAMEFVGGKTLTEIVAGDRQPLEWVLDVATQVCEGLGEAHRHGIVHRDIKSSNILLDESGRVRIVDFGLAVMAGGENLTEAGTIIGTVSYMSPEQVRGEETDQRSDLFSLGVVLYELLAGVTPFKRKSDIATLHAIAHEEPTPIEFGDGPLAIPLRKVITKLLQKDPARRYQSAEDVRVALEKVDPSSVEEIESESLHSIAVLPFANNSTDPDQEYFCDGIAEDIIADLNRLPNLRVVARTSAFAFKGKSGDVREIGEKLNVAFVLEGSVRKSGNRIRVTAQLIEVTTGFQIWAKKYDRELEDIFAIQDDIAGALVDEMKLEIDRRHPARRADEEVPFEAYQLYSRGRFELNKRTAEGFVKALEFFDASQKLAPNYAPTLAGLADAYFLMFAYDKMPPREAISRARVAVQRGLEINDQLADAHVTLGGILTFYDWDWREAEESFRKALKLSPSHATAHQWYGELLTFVGRKDEARKQLETALRLNPLSPIALTMMGWHYVRFGQYEEGLKFLRQAEEIGSTNDYNYSLISYCLAALGDMQAAIVQIEANIKRLEFSEALITTRALLYAATGDLASVRQTVREFTVLQQTAYVSQPYLAALHHVLGDETSAVACLNEALRRHDAELIFMAVMPYYSGVRTNPRLSALLAILGLS